jgi:hypothetical protein
VLFEVLTRFFRKGFKVGLPARAPADVPLPHPAEKRPRILVIPCPEAAFLAIAHGARSLPLLTTQDPLIFYGISNHFARTSLKKKTRITMAVARIDVFILRHSRKASQECLVLFGQ